MGCTAADERTAINLANERAAAATRRKGREKGARRG